MSLSNKETLLPCPFCGASAEYDSQRWQVRRREHLRSVTGHAVTCSICPTDVGLFDCKEDAVAAWNKRTPLGNPNEPHPAWKPGDKSARHPQTEAEWDQRTDPTDSLLECSRRRLNVACDYADPRAPDQMALVLRIDLLRLISDWTHKNAAWESWRRPLPSGN